MTVIPAAFRGIGEYFLPLFGGMLSDEVTGSRHEKRGFAQMNSIPGSKTLGDCHKYIWTFHETTNILLLTSSARPPCFRTRFNDTTTSHHLRMNRIAAQEPPFGYDGLHMIECSVIFLLGDDHCEDHAFRDSLEI